MRKIFITLALLSSAVILSGCFWQQTPSDEGWQRLPKTGSQVEPSGIKYETYTVEMTQSGFSPSPLTINIGDSVKFITLDDGSYWPASAMHPTHKVYPGSDIKKCGTSEQDGIFDACKWLPQGQSFTFTFNQAGTWGYHDHLNAKLFGKIIVNNRAGSSAN